MYRKQDKAQLTMDEFYIPFGDGLDANNRWVKIARLIPWDFIEEQYAKNFSEESGRPSIPSRVAFGASYIKEEEKQFGASSEKSRHDGDQLSFFNEAEVLADANVPVPELIEIPCSV